MRGMQEGAAATGRDVLALAFDEARVMMAVAGEHGAQAMILFGKIGKARQVGEVRESRFGILGVDIGPARLAGADDQARTGVHPFAGDMAEKIDLRLVDVAGQLDVGAPQPPAIGQGQGEIAPRLPRLAAAERAAKPRHGPARRRSAAAEQAEER